MTLKTLNRPLEKRLNIASKAMFIMLFMSACLVAKTSYAADFPAPFSQSFKSTLAGFRLNSERTLRELEDGRYEFSVTAKSVMARYSEKSIFRLDSNGDIFPLEHSVKSRVFGISRSEHTQFDWEQRQATYKKKKKVREVDIEPGILEMCLARKT